MTSLSFNTTAPGTTALISMHTMASAGKKSATEKNYIYSFVPKNSSRKSATRLSAIDWDLNMNELEFE